MGVLLGRIENGQIKLTRPALESDGQTVLVIPIPVPGVGQGQDPVLPPLELLEEDAKEFRRRPETLTALNRGELA